MITVDQLKQFGANTEEGLARCFGNEALYLKLVSAVPAEGSFQALKEAVDANDLQKGFEAAHALKGVLGNLSLTPLYEKASEITELLRGKTQADYGKLIDELFAQKDELDKLCQG